jgi:hypothetical protein
MLTCIHVYMHVYMHIRLCIRIYTAKPLLLILLSAQKYLLRLTLSLCMFSSQVRVGLGHRITSTQAGSLEEYYNFDLQLTYPFRLTSNEINLAAFCGAFLVVRYVSCPLDPKS